MLRLTRFLTRSLSARISLMVVSAVAVLLTAALFIMFRFSRTAVKEEALQKAEQTLEATVQHVDNVLLAVEQSVGNVYWDMMAHLDQPERMLFYSRKVVETNPYIDGCAIAFEPYYFKDRELFMAYVHRAGSGDGEAADTTLVEATTFGNKPYVDQMWYFKPVKTGMPGWVDPLSDSNHDDEAVTTFCLPIYGKEGKPIGVLAADVSLALLSKIVLAAKPSPNSYATLLGSDGSYIVHPDSSKLYHQTIFTKLGDSPTAMEIGEAMVAGESGYRSFPLNGIDNYVFYKPFTRKSVPGRSMEDSSWSIGIVYPEDDIFGEYNQLLYLVVAIAVIGLLLLLALCETLTHRQLLPLKLLTKSAQRIANGHYDEPIPDSHQQDEVGRLQDHFRYMQQALAINMGELEHLTDVLKERGEVLEQAYERAKEADRMKTAVLHNMTNHMMTPVGDITTDVETLCGQYQSLGSEEVDRLVNDIQCQGKAITELLNNLLVVSQEELKK